MLEVEGQLGHFHGGVQVDSDDMDIIISKETGTVLELQEGSWNT